MMRLLLIGSVALFFAACDPCKGLDCVTSDNIVQLKFISDTLGANLFFGDYAIYDPDSLTVTDLENSAPYDPGINHESFLIEVPDGKSFVVEYPGAFKDTVHIQTSGQNTKCCGYILEYHDISYDGQVYPSQNTYSNYYLIRK